MSPNPVDGGFREEWIVCCGQPLSEHFAAVRLGRDVDVPVQQQVHLHGLAGAWLLDFTGGGRVDDFFFGRVPLLSSDSSEGRGNAVIVVLRPTLERMVVALRALNADAEEEL